MKISDLINYISCIPEDSFSHFQNGEIQAYGRALGTLRRGNLYLNNRPALNYYIYNSNQIELCFVLNNDDIIGYKRFMFNADNDLQIISEKGKEYSISPEIVTYFEKLLKCRSLQEDNK